MTDMICCAVDLMTGAERRAIREGLVVASLDTPPFQEVVN
jgi:hypothetical protein